MVAQNHFGFDPTGEGNTDPDRKPEFPAAPVTLSALNFVTTVMSVYKPRLVRFATPRH
jgi:hypothetical protein